MKYTDVSKDTVENNLREALKRLLENDAYLLEKDVNERSISHRLAMYLQQLFGDWHVDCEYNKDHDDPKKLNFSHGQSTTKTNDTNAKTVYPDIIIHHRGTAENLVVIEIKKTTNSDGTTFDIKKLKAFKEELCYRFSVSLILKTGCCAPGIKELKYI